MGSRTRVLRIGQNVWQLAQCFHIPDYIMYIHVHVHRVEDIKKSLHFVIVLLLRLRIVFMIIIVFKND